MATTPHIATLLFGAYRRAVLARLLLRPEDSVHVRELAREIDKPAGTLLRELNALAGVGLLKRERSGNQVRFQADASCPIFEDLRNILKKTVGVADVLRGALAPIAAKVDAAFIFGSVASGEERPGSDIDLMVVGHLRFEEVVAALQPTHEALRREVNPVVYPALEFRKTASSEPFLKHVLAAPKIFILGGEDDLGQPAAHRKAQGPSARRRARRPAARRR